MVAFDELCRQLAFYNCGDTAYFDIIILVFNLLTYWNTSQSLFLGSFARGVVPQTNMKLVTAALEIIFASQRADGTWMKGEPINNQADESNTSRDIGNNYVFFFDVLSGILEEMGESHPQLLAPYLDKLTRYFCSCLNP